MLGARRSSRRRRPEASRLSAQADAAGRGASPDARGPPRHRRPQPSRPLAQRRRRLGGGRRRSPAGRHGAVDLRAIVNLDGRWGDELEANLERYDRRHPGRFVTFCHLDWRETAAPGFGERLAQSLRRSLAAGARGLKVWKDLGLSLTDERGRLLLPDDQRLAPVWEVAAQRGRSGAHPHRRPAGLLRPARRDQRTARRASGQPRLVARASRRPALRAPARGARGPRGRQPGDDLHRRAPGRRRRGPGQGGALAARLSEPVRRHRRAHRRAGPPAAPRAGPDRATRPACPVRHRRLSAEPGRVRHPLPLPGDAPTSTSPTRSTSPRRRGAGASAAWTCPTTCWTSSTAATPAG